jgi:hypothetical protein
MLVAALMLGGGKRLDGSQEALQDNANANAN